MEEMGGGSIINISSVVGEYGNIGQANYAASKAGVIGLTKTWAKEFARKGVPVRCNAIAPGYIMTDMMKTVPEELLQKFAGLTMLGRLGQPEEIAKAALFLASDDASYVTGHVLSVNGGMRL
jgi:3-oxoacyl-[acyl-carrier protein] reductase